MKGFCLGIHHFKRKMFVVGIQTKISRLQVYLLVVKLMLIDKTMNLFNLFPWRCLSLFLCICIFYLSSITLTHYTFLRPEVFRATADQRHLEERLANKTLLSHSTCALSGESEREPVYPKKGLKCVRCNSEWINPVNPSQAGRFRKQLYPRH